MTRLTLPIQPAAYWLHAHGEGGGADFDLVMERDQDGLPLLRGRHIRGLLRLALERADKWNWFDTENVCGLLMGDRGQGAPGCLAVTDAVASPALRNALLGEPALVDGLFVRIPSTAIDADTGAAKARHLRTVEAALPLPLLAEVTFEPETRQDWTGGEPDLLAEIELARARWRDWVATAWPAFDEVGAKRTRGFGTLLFTELAV